MGKWTEQDMTLLQLKYPTQGAQISELLVKYSPNSIRRKAGELGVARVAWSKEEDALLQELYLQKGTDIPELLAKHSRSAISARAIKLGMRKVWGWTIEEDSILRKKYPIQGSNIPELLAKHSIDGIKNRAGTLGIRVSAFWTPEEDALLRRLYPTVGSEIPELLKRHTAAAVQSRASDLGVSKPRKSPARKSSFYTKWAAEDEELLSKCYPVQGSAIPELLARYSARAIQLKANRLGIKAVTPGTVARSNSNIKAAAAGYIGTDGKPYFYVRCAACNRVLLLSAEVALSFSHGLICDTHSIPWEYLTHEAKTVLFHNKRQE